jgi:hypothetical protein
MAEMSHSRTRNFSPSSAFKYIETSGRWEAQESPLKTTVFGRFPGSDQTLGGTGAKGVHMRYLRYVALLAVLMSPLAYSQAQVQAGVAVGNDQGYTDQGYDQGYADPGPGYVNGPPVCSYGYYSYYPYACAPYGFYGPQWFAGGIFIGAGPWYHWGWGHGGYYGRAGYYGHGYYGRGFVGGRGYAGGYARGTYGRGYAGNYARGGYARSSGGGSHVGGGFHGAGGGGFHGGGGHGGGHR